MARGLPLRMLGFAGFMACAPAAPIQPVTDVHDADSATEVANDAGCLPDACTPATDASPDSAAADSARPADTDAAPLDVAPDADACTGPGCQDAAPCVPSQPDLDCDDADPCTLDACVPGSHCSHAPIADCARDVPYLQRFDCNPASWHAWTLDLAPPEAPGWRVDAAPPLPIAENGFLSPDCSLNFNAALGMGCAPDLVASGHATGPWIDATDLVAGQPLFVRYWLGGAMGPADSLWLDVRGKGQPWQPLHVNSGSSGWQLVHVALAPWAGQKFQLRLRFQSLSCFDSPHSGPYVDDFEVRAGICDKSDDCDDLDVCTADACKQGLCVAAGLPKGAACDDGNPCTAGDICKFGQCTGSPKKKTPCDDGNWCTGGDECVEGSCKGKPVSIACNDGDPCTSSDHCAGGVCASTMKPCSDGNPCTADACDPHTGACAATPLPDASACLDGDACTNFEHCFGGACLGRPVCDDGNPCTEDVCQPTPGNPMPGNKVQCSNVALPAGSACNDDDPCTTGAVCQGKDCKPLGFGPCTVTLLHAFDCDGDAGFVFDPPSDPTRTTWGVDGLPQVPGQDGCSLNFNDGATVACYPGEAKAAGTATSAAIALLGAKQAVLRFRSMPAVGDAAVRWLTASADGFATAGKATWLGPPSTSWKTERIDLTPLAGKNAQVRWHVDTAGCAPNAAGWFVDDIELVTDLPTPCTSDFACEDGKPCTFNTCTGGSCTVAYPGGNCSDGNACSQGDGCDAQGNCLPGTAISCDDGNPCTVDACGVEKGCSHETAKDGTGCGGGICAVAGMCLSGACLALPSKCDDGNPCTTDLCDAKGACSWVVAPEGSPCDDGDPCTGAEICQTTTCKGTASPCTLVLGQDFACGKPNAFTFDGDGKGPQWAVDATPKPPGHHSPACSLNFNNGQDIECELGQQNVAGTATTQSFSLIGAKSATAVFWSWSEVGGFDTADLRLVEASGDDFKTIPVRTWLPNSKGGKKWRRTQIKLDALGGKPAVKLRFRFDSLDCTANLGAGWFVDDLTIVRSDAEVCGKDSDCTAMGVCATAKCVQAKCSVGYGQNACNDFDACTGLDHCDGLGLCIGGALKLCSDGDPCTLDTCDVLSGCKATKKGEGAGCNDGNECMIGESCKQGLCVGQVMADGTNCTNAEPCTLNDTCKAGVCIDGAKDVTGAACADNDPCTVLETCQAGKCKAGKSPCDDGEPCTVDFCNPINAFEHECDWQPVLDAQPCDDGDPCTLQDQCGQGACDGNAGPCFALLADTFECGVKKGWLLDLPVGQVQWKIDGLPKPPAAHSPDCSLNFNNDANLDAGKLLPLGTATSAPVVVPLKGQTAVRLWSWFAGEPGDFVHQRFVEVLHGDFQTVLQSAQIDNAKHQGVWQKIRVSLQKFAGQKIRLRLRMEVKQAGFSGYPGWFVDDIAVQAAQPDACSKDLECVDDPAPCIDAQCLAGKCELVVLDGQPCDDGNACTTATACVGAACIGKPLDCDDGYACTADVCYKTLGCENQLQPACGVVTLPYEITFTCGDPANTYWLLDKPADGPKWGFDAAPDPPGALSPDCSLNFNNGKDFTCAPGQSKVDGVARLPTFNLASHPKGTPLGIRFFLGGSWEPGAADDLLLEASGDNGKSWKLLGSYDAEPGWRPVKADVSEFAGGKAYLRFRFASADCLGNASAGPFIDNLRVFDNTCGKTGDCEDDDPCTDDACEQGLCQHSFNAAPCDDGSLCTAGDACTAGQCVGAAKTCADTNPCTDDTCDSTTGLCSHAPKGDGSFCSDGEACTANDACKASACIGQAKSDGSACSDGNACSTGDKCTSGVCKGAGAATDGSACTDNDPCTAADACKAGICTGAKKACDDGDPCTLDACEKLGTLSKKCSHKPNCP